MYIDDKILEIIFNIKPGSIVYRNGVYALYYCGLFRTIGEFLEKVYASEEQLPDFFDPEKFKQFVTNFTGEATIKEFSIEVGTISASDRLVGEKIPAIMEKYNEAIFKSRLDKLSPDQLTELTAYVEKRLRDTEVFTYTLFDNMLEQYFDTTQPQETVTATVEANSTV